MILSKSVFKNKKEIKIIYKKREKEPKGSFFDLIGNYTLRNRINSGLNYIKSTKFTKKKFVLRF